MKSTSPLEQVPRNFEATTPQDVIIEGWVMAVDARHKTLLIMDGMRLREIEFGNADNASTLGIGCVVQLALEPGDAAFRMVPVARRITVLATAADFPFDPLSSDHGDPTARARYRYLELRNPAVADRFRLRHRLFLELSRILDELGYIHIETPLLAAPSTSGAAEFKVTGNRDMGRTYALPQSPQLFGHILVIGGILRYFQWARCFRDEDLRTNRQLEFTQLHIEAAFVDEAKLMALVETLVAHSFAIAGVQDLPAAERLTFFEAMRLYGTEKPDLRIAPQFTRLPISVTVEGEDRQVFVMAGPANMLIDIAALKNFQALAERRRFLVVGFFDPARLEKARLPLRATLSDLERVLGPGPDPSPTSQLLLVGDWSGHAKLSRDVYVWLEAQRAKSASGFRPVWITDMPMFEEDPAEKGRLKPFGHPFLAPSDVPAFRQATRNHELLDLKGRAFDLVINGEELASGSILIHDPELQVELFSRLGLSKRQMSNMFGVVLDALATGAPPLGGIGLGVDRLLAMITGSETIRDVVVFPKSRQGLCPVFQRR